MSSSKSQQEYRGDALAADFRYLVEQLETAHPDPYSGFGGKVFFHKAAFELENRLTHSQPDISEFYREVSMFLANIGDGHTCLYPMNEEDTGETRVLPVSLRTVPDGLIIQRLPEEYRHLLGSRVVAVGGMPLDSVLTNVSVLRPCENLYGRYSVLCGNIWNGTFMRQLFPAMGDTLDFSLVTPDGSSSVLELPLLAVEEARSLRMAENGTWDGMPSGNLAYRFMDSGHRVMLFNVESIMARDNFEFMYDNGWGGLEEQLSGYYALIGETMPSDIREAISQLPSFSGIFNEMLLEMKENSSTTLIIDLRGNSGGWTPIVLPTLYQLYGSRFLEENISMEYYRLISPLYLEKINTDIETFNRNNHTHWRLGDYTFFMPDTTSVPMEERCRSFVENSMSCVRDDLSAQHGKPVYTPRQVYVVTDSRTYSAAFHYAWYLCRMGAVVVGVPCSQSPNAFMEQTPFRLPNTGLQGSISNSIQILFPSDDPRARTFWPDVMLTYEDYADYGFDTESEILYLLDNLI